MKILLLVFGLAIVAVGCGGESTDTPSIGGYQWKTVYRTDVQSVCVPIFGTRDFHRGVEFQVSDALVHQIEAFTPYKVEPRERADTILEGEIIAVRTTPLSLSESTDVPQEQLAAIVVNFTWKDLHTGKILAQRKNFEQAATYYPTLGEGQFVGEQSAAEKLAAGIVHEMESAW
jgi:lipopolysaccharide assembly LptE-like protein